MKKYYAVKNGREKGIFESWDVCKNQVIGFSGAEYKSFLSIEEAEAYIKSSEGLIFEDTQKGDGFIDLSVNDAAPLNRAVAYVDGSYNIKTKEFSFGAVILHNNTEKHFKEKFNDKELALMRNVAGEIKGAEFAMSYCIDNDIKAVDIYHDYEGVARWPLGSWKANKVGTIAYKEFYDNAKKSVRIHFVKVKGHSGDKYNDLADKLAKEALGIV